MSKIAANATLIVAFVQAIITLAVAFGWDITEDQIAAILGACTVALAVLGLWFHPDVPIGSTTDPSA